MPVSNCQKVACGFVGIVSFAALGMGIAGLIPRGLEFPTGVASGLTGGGGLALMGLVALAKSNCYSSKTRSEADNPPANEAPDSARGRSRSPSSFSDEKEDGFGGPGSVAGRRLSAANQEVENDPVLAATLRESLLAAKGCSEGSFAAAAEPRGPVPAPVITEEARAVAEANLKQIYQIMNENGSIISDLMNKQKIGQEVPPALIDKWKNDVWPKWEACDIVFSEYSWNLLTSMEAINDCLNRDTPKFSEQLLKEAAKVWSALTYRFSVS